jgi:hypothetical protein
MRKFKYKFLVSSSLLTVMACTFTLEGHPSSYLTTFFISAALANLAVFIYFIMTEKKEPAK